MFFCSGTMVSALAALREAMSASSTFTHSLAASLSTMVEPPPPGGPGTMPSQTGSGLGGAVAFDSGFGGVVAQLGELTALGPVGSAPHGGVAMLLQSVAPAFAGLAAAVTNEGCISAAVEGLMLKTDKSP